MLTGKFSKIVFPEAGLTAADVASQLNLSPGYAKDSLASFFKKGLLTRTLEGGAYRYFQEGKKKAEPKVDPVFDIPDTVIHKAPLTKKEKRKPREGRGQPEAKKIVNPQETLELKKEAVLSVGGQMLWLGRMWHIKTNKGVVRTIPSRHLAQMTISNVRAIAKDLPLEDIVLNKKDQE